MFATPRPNNRLSGDKRKQPRQGYKKHQRAEDQSREDTDRFLWHEKDCTHGHKTAPT